MYRRIMQQGLIGILAGLLSWTSVGGAANEAANGVPQLIQDLGSSEYARRETAMRDLDALGSAALPALREAVQSEDLEIQRRSQALVEQIERRVQSAQLLEPRRVHLVYRATPLGQAVADFARKTGYHLQLPRYARPGSDRTITLDTGDVSFWEALDQFCRQAGLVEQSRLPLARPRPVTADTDRLRREQEVRLLLHEEALLGINGLHSSQAVTSLALVNGQTPTLPTSQNSAVRIQALTPELCAFPMTKTPDQAQVVLEVTPEPKLDWKRVIDLRIDHAIDDQGRNLQPVVQAGKTLAEHDLELRAQAMLDGRTANLEWLTRSLRQIPVHLKTSQTTPKSIKELQGTLSALVLTPPEVLGRVDDLLKASGKMVALKDGSDLKVVEVRRGVGNQVYLRVEVPAAFGQGGVDPMINRRLRMGRMLVTTVDTSRTQGSTNWTLLDATGRQLPLTRMDTRFNQKEQELVQEHLLTFHAPQGREGALQLVLSGQRLVILEIPFTLKDIPIP